ncbi:hypothetical protein [Pseudoalteromonas phage PH357]|nr:hypothetical protein [Pseudoalteromonas phage PH357]
MYNTIFEHELNKYKLVLEVTDHFNDYHQHCYTSQLKLYTMDNILIEADNYLFPVLATRFSNTILAYDYFLDHLQGRHLPSNLAYDLYVKALNNGSELAKSL